MDFKQIALISFLMMSSTFYTLCLLQSLNNGAVKLKGFKADFQVCFFETNDSDRLLNNVSILMHFLHFTLH